MSRYRLEAILQSRAESLSALLRGIDPNTTSFVAKANRQMWMARLDEITFLATELIGPDFADLLRKNGGT